MRLVIAAAAFLAAAVPALAADDPATAALPPHHYDFGFEGPFGTFDRAAVQRGYQAYRQICAACHGMKYIAFRTLGERDGPFYDSHYPNPNDNPVIRALAAEFQIEDGPDDFGDMFMREGRPSDRFPDPFPNDQAAAAVNGGAVPPDLSVITKARHHGPHYITSLMLGYQDAPADFALTPGLHYNPYFEGRQIAMGNQLFDGILTYADGTEATAERVALDLAEFLAWAAEPKAEARKRMGMAVIAFLLVLAVLTFLSYRAIWRDQPH